MRVRLEKASAGDAEVIHQLQVASFLPLLTKYQDYETNPANEDVTRIAERLAQANSTYYFIVVGDIRVGAIRIVYNEETMRARISPMFVVPEHQGKGYGQAAITLVEGVVHAKTWELQTILQEEGNCYLYEKMGYRKTGTTHVVNDKMTFVSYKKQSD